MIDPKQLLIQFNANYADEFDIEGFIVMTEEQWEAHKKMAEDFFEKKKSAHPKPAEIPTDHTDPGYWKAYEAQREYERAMETEVYFGTNEAIQYSDYEDYMRAFTATPLSVQGYTVLKELFNEHHEGYEWEHDGKKHVVPTRDVIRNGMFAMLSPEEDED